MFDNTRKYRPTSFLLWKDCLFFKKLCFIPPLMSYRNDLKTSTVNVRTHFGPLQIVSWGLSHSITLEIFGQSLFFTGKVAFLFKNFLFSTTSYVLQKWSRNFHSFCQNALLILIIRPMGLVTLDKLRKNMLEASLHWKGFLFFFQEFAFSTTFYVLQKWFCNFHSNCQKTLLTVIIHPLGFATLDNSRKNRLESILHWKVAFFFKKSCFQQTLWY